MLTLADLCAELSISQATGRNWIKLGKLKPAGKKGRSFLFTEAYVQAMKDDLESGKIKSLTSRRNKTYVSGKLLYSSYIPADSPNLALVQKLVDAAESISFDDAFLVSVLAACSRQLLLDRVSEAEAAQYEPLISALEEMPEDISLSGSEDQASADGQLSDPENSSEMSGTTLVSDALADDTLKYIPGEDTLGLIYISLKALRARKSEGTYYTPGRIVQRLLGHLFEASILMDGQDKVILDPGCGTGNFLLCLPPGVPAENLYGYDTDEISVKIARINLALKYCNPGLSFWESHILPLDFLSRNPEDMTFDIIFGNPPWGSSFTPDEKALLSSKFECAKRRSVDSFDLFTEQALRLLKNGGTLSYVLPESLILVKTHSDIRELLLRDTVLTHVEYLGDVFDHVQCPSIILQVKKSEGLGDFLSEQPRIYDRESSFRITSGRDTSGNAFDFIMPDEEYALLEKLSSLPGVQTLEGNADFALGIVTGANKEMLKSRKTPKNEIILKGTDIFKYTFHIPKCYIHFEPEKCQQVAPLSMYRAPEKLLYRFIGGRLVFSYDDQKTLSLNSCNIVIPCIKNLKIKYILAILNCSVSDYFFRKKFRSVKILRSHIEQLPIPFADEHYQDEIISKIDSILALCKKLSPSDDSDEIFTQIDTQYSVRKLFYELDDMCFKLFNLSDNEINLIKEDIYDENLFLPL